MEYKYNFLVECYECRGPTYLFEIKRVYSTIHNIQGMLCRKCFNEQDDTVMEFPNHITPQEMKISLN